MNRFVVGNGNTFTRRCDHCGYYVDIVQAKRKAERMKKKILCCPKCGEKAGILN